jgi:Fe-S-cluster-containing hydrogenase component 2
MNKMLSVVPKKCTNCRMCELACSLAKTGEFNPAKSRIRVNAFPEELAYIPLACFQCSDAPCVKICPSGALTEETGLVRHDPDKCIGCKMCMVACPFGVISFDSSEGVTTKCDNCDGDPQCVKFCAFGALEFKESELSDMTKAEDFARKIVEASKA